MKNIAIIYHIRPSRFILLPASLFILTPMEKMRLGRTNLSVSRSGFGALPIQRVPTDEAVRLLRRAYESGIDFFDTARYYSNSEEKIGKALSARAKQNRDRHKSDGADEKRRCNEFGLKPRTIKERLR